MIYLVRFSFDDQRIRDPTEGAWNPGTNMNPAAFTVIFTLQRFINDSIQVHYRSQFPPRALVLLLLSARSPASPRKYSNLQLVSLSLSRVISDWKRRYQSCLCNSICSKIWEPTMRWKQTAQHKNTLVTQSSKKKRALREGLLYV